MITLENLCIACSLPTKILRTEVRDQMRLHSSEDSAIEFADGYSQHYLYGIYFDKKLFKKVIEKPKFKDIISIKNTEQRMAALKHLGSEFLLTSSGALRVNESKRGNELYVIPKEQGIFDENEYFLRYKCPSTERVYVKPVPPEVGKEHDADYAQASTFKVWDMNKNGKLEVRSWTKKEYDSLALES